MLLQLVVCLRYRKSLCFVSIPQAVSAVATLFKGTINLIGIVSIPQAVSAVATLFKDFFIREDSVSIPQAVSAVATTEATARDAIAIGVSIPQAVSAVATRPRC